MFRFTQVASPYDVRVLDIARHIGSAVDVTDSAAGVAFYQVSSFIAGVANVVVVTGESFPSVYLPVPFCLCHLRWRS